MAAKSKSMKTKSVKPPKFAIGRAVRFGRQEGGYAVGEVVELHQPHGNGSAKVRLADGKELVVFAAEVC